MFQLHMMVSELHAEMFCSQGLNEQLCVQIAEIVRNPIQERNQRYLAASFHRQDGGHARTYARPGLKDMY